MRKMSLASAKARMSELVDDVEHHGRKILILRHGKPVAVLVPVSAVAPPPPVFRKSRARRMKSIKGFVEEFSGIDGEVSAVADLLAGRR